MLFLLPLFFTWQLPEADLLGKWKVFMEDGILTESVFTLEFKKDHSVDVIRENVPETLKWKLINGKKSALVMIGEEDLFAINRNGDTLFLVSESLELTLLREK